MYNFVIKRKEGVADKSKSSPALQSRHNIQVPPLPTLLMEHEPW